MECLGDGGRLRGSPVGRHAQTDQIGVGCLRRIQESIDRNIRAEVDDSQNSMQKKIRENARQKIPYLLVVGDNEAGEGSVNVRRRGEKKGEEMALEAFVARVEEEVSARN